MLLPSFQEKPEEFLVNWFYVNAEKSLLNQKISFVNNDFGDLEAIYSWLKCTHEQEEGF